MENKSGSPGRIFEVGDRHVLHSQAVIIQELPVHSMTYRIRQNDKKSRNPAYCTKDGALPPCTSVAHVYFLVLRRLQVFPGRQLRVQLFVVAVEGHHMRLAISRVGKVEVEWDGPEVSHHCAASTMHLHVKLLMELCARRLLKLKRIDVLYKSYGYLRCSGESSFKSDGMPIQRSLL